MEAGPCTCTCAVHKNSVTNSLLATRDAGVKATHDAQLAAKDRQIAKHKWTNDDLSKQLFDLRKRSKRLANDLGFEDLWEAQVAVDTADVPFVRSGGDGEGEERPWTYREALQSFEEMEKLRIQLAAAQAQNEDLTRSLERLRQETEELVQREETVNSAKTSNSALQSKLANLQRQYDALLDVKERAAARYKVDYAKWKRFHDWIFTDDVEHAYAEKKGMSEEEKEREERRRWKESVKRKKLMMMELGPKFNIEEDAVSATCPPPLGGITNLLDSHSPVQAPAQIRADKENLATSPARPSLPSLPSYINTGTANIRSKTTPQSLRAQVLDSAAHARSHTDATLKAPSSSPTLFNETTPSASSALTGGRTPLVFRPVLSAAKRSPIQVDVVKQELGSSPPLSNDSRKRAHPDLTGSSDTEEDSQAVGSARFPAPAFKVPSNKSPPTSPVAPASSQTEADSQSQLWPFPFPFDPTPCPAPGASSKSSTSIASNFSTTTAIATPRPFALPPRPVTAPQPRRVVSRDVESLQPTKMRRLSDSDEDDNNKENEYQKEEATPQPKTKGKGKEKPPRRSLPLMKGKGKAMHPPPPVSTPANRPTGQKNLLDYSAFKGRGRYGKAADKDKDSSGTAKNAPDKMTINAVFEIDPTRNGGLDFQFDEVVRTREDRRRMDAGDCECCRDYYEAIGPLLNRLQAPLWRSPSATPAKPCTRHQHLSASASKASSNQAHTNAKTNDASSHRGGAASSSWTRREEITSHRQAISRHRHHWERAKTPPGYWNIGFPDTQETEEINERAREMHRKKLESIERAADEGGKYRRRS